MQLKTNPGALSFVTPEMLSVMPKGIGAEEALRLVPGIRIDNQHDGERVHVSIRGQGILTERGLRGIGVLFADPNLASQHWTEQKYRSAIEYRISLWVPYNNSGSELIRVWGNHVAKDIRQGYDRMEDNIINGVAKGYFTIPLAKLGATSIGDQSATGYELVTWFYDCETMTGSSVFLPYDPRTDVVNYHYSLLDKANTTDVEPATDVSVSDIIVTLPGIVRKDETFTATIEGQAWDEVEISMFNVLGHRTGVVNRLTLRSGTSLVSLSSHGLAQGVSFVQFSGKHGKAIIKKMLVY